MKIVKFKNGKYGVRRFFVCRYEYLSSGGAWWGKSSAFDSCIEIEHSKEKAEEIYNAITDKGEPV